jgi:uncharacterized protein DUF6632
VRFRRTGAHFTVPLESHAFSLEADFAVNPENVFSVEERVRLWGCEGRYWILVFHLVNCKLQPDWDSRAKTWGPLLTPSIPEPNIPADRNWATNSLFPEVAMRRERVLKVVLVLVGLFFLASVYPLITSIREGWQANKEETEPMAISLYVTQGVFLLLAARNPSANRGVITLTAWLNIAHAAVMTVMSIHLPNERRGLLTASAMFGLIGVALIALSAPSGELEERVSVAST